MNLSTGSRVVMSCDLSLFTSDLCMQLSKILLLMSMEQLFLFFTLFRLMSMDKLCNTSFISDESFCGGGWWLIDFTSVTFWFALLLGGGYLTRFSILLGCL